MTVRVVHSKVSGLPASTDTSLVSGTHWDEDHVVTGLENVDNTSDLNKPISTATQTALDAKQALDADLTAIAGLSSTGLIARTGSGTVSVRTVTAPAAGITVSNGDGVSGNPTIALANDLSALEGLSSTGLAARTATDTWAQRTITGTSGHVSVSNGDGVSGNPTLSLAFNSLTADTSPDSAADYIVTYDTSAAAYKKALLNSFARERLAAARTYYVRTDGSDSNTGLANSAGGAFLTIQKAIDTAVALDLSIYSITIQVGAGTYTSAIALKSYIGVGPILINGDTATPSNVVISTTSASCLTADTVRGKYQFRGFKLTTTTSGYGLFAAAKSVLEYGNIEFGAMPSPMAHIYATSGAQVSAIADYSITGSAYIHIQAFTGAFVSTASRTVTLTGTPAFTYYANVTNGAGYYAYSMTFTGSATGTRYYAAINAWIDTVGGGASYFPGNAAGSTATGGQYA